MFLNLTFDLNALLVAVHVLLLNIFKGNLEMKNNFNKILISVNSKFVRMNCQSIENQFFKNSREKWQRHLEKIQLIGQCSVHTVRRITIQILLQLMQA